MTIIGTFTKQDNAYQGTLATLTLKAKVAIKPVESKNSEKAPDYRVFVGTVEIGAAWAVTAKSGNEYLSIRLDDPSFAAPIACSLLTRDNDYALIWKR